MEHFELLVEESKPGDYVVLEAPNGDRYIVPEGLDPEQIHQPYGMEAFMLEHYDAFAFAYWVLLFCIFSYLIISFILVPLYRRAQQGLPLLADE